MTILRNLNIFKKVTQRHRSKFTWRKPNGCSTNVCIYNPITKRNEALIPYNSSYLSWYSCGPTVYDVSHIGHASSYVRIDIIQRVLSYWFNLNPIVALGITDIDDKIITRSKAEQLDFREVAKKYEIEFHRDMRRLNILEPHFILRVSDHILDIIQFVSGIIASGHAYALKDGNVYFDTQSLAHYGKVTRAPVIEFKEAKEGQRRHPADFALWKPAKPDEPSWPSPWGAGRPGWHIECSAMASKIFNNNIDIHAGGLDLAFPHHENEEAQSCAFHSCDQWVNYWVHTGHLLMNGMKMSKSMKNFISIDDYLKSHTADQLRMLCLITYYRSSVDYTPEVMKKAVALTDKFKMFLESADGYCKGSWTIGCVNAPEILESLQNAKVQIISHLANDINTTLSINVLEDLVKTCNLMLHNDVGVSQAREVVAVAAVADFVRELLESFGLFQYSENKAETNLNDYIIEKSVLFRNEIRQIAGTSDKSVKKDLYKACDTFRSDLKAVNITIKDTNGTVWSKNS